MNATVSAETRTVGVDMRIEPARFRLPPDIRDRIIRFFQRQVQLDKLKDKINEKRIDIEKQDLTQLQNTPATPGTTVQPSVTVPALWFRDP